MNARCRVLGAALTCAFAAVPLLALPPRAPDAVTLFNEQCSGCHSIGGGELAGPDLQGLDVRPVDDVRAAVVRMEEHVGPLATEQVDALVALLRDPSAKVRLAGGEAKPAAPAGSPANGRRLFHGEASLRNGAVACFACHAADGRGGTLAGDLTRAHVRLADAGLLAVTERPAFTAMKAVYGKRPVTREEAVDIAAYLRETAQGPAQTDARDEPTTAVHGAAAGVAVAVFGAVVVMFRPRRRALRAGKSRR